MSGGAYDYITFKFMEMADTLRHTDTDPRRAAFAKLLKLVAKATHDIEWVDSCDYGPGDDHASIDAVFAFLGKDPEIIKKAAAYDSMKTQLKEFFKDIKDHTTPEEKAEQAYQTILQTQELNKKICEIGVCIHKEHQKG